VISKEFDRKGLPVALITTVYTLAQQVRANRIVRGVAIPHPCGDPGLPPELDYRLRKRVVETALKAIQTPVNGPTVLTPGEEEVVR
jgi:glycine reductase